MGRNYDIYNCHSHTFQKEDVPAGFLPFGLVKVISTKVGFGTLRAPVTNALSRIEEENTKNAG